MVEKISRILISTVFLISLFFIKQSANATISSCSATVSPTTVNTITSQSYTFTLGSVSGVLWVRVTRPSSNFTITSGSGSGWNVSTADSTATFTPVGQSAGSATINVTATSGSSEASSANWTVQVSDDGGGASPTTCSGSLGTAISGAGSDTTAPEISAITISEVSTSSVKITWTTNENANSVVEYGTTDSYGSTKSDSTSTTSHSLTLSDLSANTTYHYQIKSTDSSSNEAATDDDTYTTAKVGDPTPTPKTVTTTVTKEVTKADSTNPVVKIDPLTETVFKDLALISGSAIDDREVSEIAYTLDSGKSWNNVKKTKNLNTASADFEIVLTGLKTGAYKIKVRAKDAKGNTGESVAFPFEIDQKGPTVTFSTNFSKPFSQAPKITGKAEEKSGEASVEYSVDAGKNWLPVDKIQIASKEATLFEFTPALIDDDNYTIAVRGKDRLGNIGDPAFATLVIDRLPPLVGGMLAYLGAQMLTPSDEEVFYTTTHIEHLLIFSAVGGPTKIELVVKESKTGQEILKKSLVKNKDSNLWVMSLVFDKEGDYEVFTFAQDGAGQKTDKKVARFKVYPNGQVIDKTGVGVQNASIRLFVKDYITSDFHQWDATAYQEINPQVTDENGRYRLFLPRGKYYLEAKKIAYKTLRSEIFEVKEPAAVVSNLNLEPAPMLKLGFIQIPLPYFRATSALVDLSNSPTHSGGVQESKNLDNLSDLKLYSEAKNFPLLSLRGKQTVISLLNTWWPQVSQQLQILEQFANNNPDRNVVAVFPHESDSRVSLYKKRGGYKVNFVADPDGGLAKFLSYDIVPTHFFLNRSLKAERKFVGILSVEEMGKNVVE